MIRSRRSPLHKRCPVLVASADALTMRLGEPAPSVGLGTLRQKTSQVPRS